LGIVSGFAKRSISGLVGEDLSCSPAGAGINVEL
jgi:hypothetical protein